MHGATIKIAADTNWVQTRT